ncbi:MAG: hypothetical protein ACKOX6_16865 [Bdellovibrio sp.]
MDTQQEMLEQALREAREHQEILQSIKIVLATPPGRAFVKYLLSCFEVGVLPEAGLPNDFLRDRLGFLRAGNSVFKIISEANHEVAAQLLAQLEKERHDQIYNSSQIRQG